MNEVQPIRDKAKIEAMKTELLKRGYRNYLLFVVGINTGLRVSDILNLRVKDVRGKSHISLTEKKTGKAKRFIVNEQLRAELDRFISGMGEDEYLFQSRKGDNKPLTRVQVYRVLNDAAVKVGLEEIGTHTLRKTFGYWHYQQFKDVALLQHLFNHSAPSVTKRYIGITQDEIDKTMEEFFL